MVMKKQYLFQFATEQGKILENTDLLNIKEAKKLWKENYPKAIKFIQEGIGVEMYIWKNAKNNEDYGETLITIENDFITDGKYIYPPKPEPIKIDL